MTAKEKLEQQLEQCHKALYRIADDFEELSRRDRCTPFQQDQWAKVAVNLRALVARQKEGKV